MLVVMKVPSAPAWNIAALWVGAGLIALRILYGVMSGDGSGFTGSAVAKLAVVVVSALVWAALWTMYFLQSDRVARTFA